MATTTSNEHDPLAEEIDVPILVQGARGSFERDALIGALAEASEGIDASIQAFAPEAVYGCMHLEAAARRAVRSHQESRAIARNLSVEIACYAAGTDQIEDALAAVGVPEQGYQVILCAVGDQATQLVEDALQQAGLSPDEDIVERHGSALDRLGISSAQRDRSPDSEQGLLVLEHVALLDAKR